MLGTVPLRKEVHIIPNQEPDRKEVKRRFQLWIKPSTLALAEKLYADDNCESRSEFIKKAVIFYAGYLSSENAQSYLPSEITPTVKGIVMEAVARICGMLFKMSVGQIEMKNITMKKQKKKKRALGQKPDEQDHEQHM